ncbi:MAG: GreA/GreB family elongation factor [Opitutales bacterium]
MNSTDVEIIISKNPKLIGKEKSLEAMQAEKYCIHNSWGIGKITDIDVDTNRIIIDFDGKPAHSMDIAFCVDKLLILDDENIIVKHKKDPKTVDEDMKKDPAGFVMNILRTKEDNEMSSIELENILIKLFDSEKSYKAWWKIAKKDLEKNAMVSTPKKKNDPYSIREVELKPEIEALNEYMLHRNPKKKIELAEKLHAIADDVEAIKDSLPTIRKDLTEAIKDAKGLTQADRLRGIWVRNDFIRHIERQKLPVIDENAPNKKELIEAQNEEIERLVEKEKPCSKDILDEAKTKDEKNGLNDLAKNLHTSYYERFLDLLTRTYESEWKELIVSLLRNSEGKFTNECVNFFIAKDSQKESKFTGQAVNTEATTKKTEQITTESGCKELVKESFKKWLSEQTLLGPVILWIVKNRNTEKYKTMLSELINHKLLSALLTAVDQEALLSDSNKKIALAETLSEDKELVLDTLYGKVLPIKKDAKDTKKDPARTRDKNSASDDTAKDLAQTLILNQGFEDLTKKSILARFIKYSPAVQSLVSTAVKEVERLLVSEWSLKAKKAELEDIKSQQPASKKAIEAARELGDLRENAEYHMAREHDQLLSARRAELEREISIADPIDFSGDTSAVHIGSTVTVLSSQDNKEHTYTILGAWDSDTSKNIFSYLTPIAKAMLEKKAGASFETNVEGHKIDWKILKIEGYKA